MLHMSRCERRLYIQGITCRSVGFPCPNPSSPPSTALTMDFRQCGALFVSSGRSC